MNIISRAEAKQLGLKRYFTGKPCKHGHIAERRTIKGDCTKCIKRVDKNNYKARQKSKLEKQKEYYLNNSDKIKNYQSNYRENNKDKINARHHRRYKTDPTYRLNLRMRSMLRKQVEKFQITKTTKTVESLGYSSSQLKEHIESLFVDGMSWSNYGDWHIDHIIPVSAWVKAGVTDPKVINALDNLQPLWANDNLVKGDRII